MAKLNLDNMHSPCILCYQQLNHQYNEDSTMCQKCEYNIAIQLLKTVLKYNNHCAMCKNRVSLGCGYWDCKKLPFWGFTEECSNKDFEIDWEKAFKEHQVEIETKS